MSKDAIYLVELYQSRAREVEGWKECFSSEQLQQINGIFTFSKGIFMHKESAVLPQRFTIQKRKEWFFHKSVKYAIIM